MPLVVCDFCFAEPIVYRAAIDRKQRKVVAAIFAPTSSPTAKRKNSLRSHEAIIPLRRGFHPRGNA